VGTHGGAIIRNLHEGYQMEARLLKDVGGALVEAAPMTHLPGMETAQAHFTRCILEDRETLAPGEQGLTVMRVLDAVYESASTGREVLLSGR
jgi:predicted dehydrogenase